MRQGGILFRYIGRQYLLWFVIFLGALAGIILLFEIAELLRRAAEKPNATLGIVLQMGLFKVPETIEKILPFVVLFAGMFTFWRLTRSQELIIVRAAGLSVWQFLAPVVAVTALFGLLNVMVMNPVGARMIARYHQLESTYLLRQSSLELTGAGLWLRQNEGDREYLLHADTLTMNPLTLRPLMAFVYGPDKTYLGRIDAESATLENGHWAFAQVRLNMDNQPPRFMERFDLSTDMTVEKIEESMAAPNTISLWELPAFIRALETIGLPAVRHRMQLQSLLAEPGFLCTMALFAAAFSLRLTRRGGIVSMALGGVTVGCAAFALDNVLMALGTTQTLPVLLAAWAPPVISAASGVAALLYLEDG